MEIKIELKTLLHMKCGKAFGSVTGKMQKNADFHVTGLI
jgi:hypothetical protein